MVKSFVNNVELTKKISEISFQILNSEDLKQYSELKVANKSLYNATDKKASPFGVLDSRLGVSNSWDDCETCGLTMKDCLGHFGYIDLALPTFHIGFLPQCHRIMQCICKFCFKILLSEKEQSNFTVLQKVDQNCIDYLNKKRLFKAILSQCRKVRNCPHCGKFNGLVKKVSIFRMCQSAFSDTKNGLAQASDFRHKLSHVLRKNSEFDSSPNAPASKQFHNIFTQTTILQIFSKIDDKSLQFLAMNGMRPHNMLLKRIAVPPVCIRPSVVSDFRPGTQEDDITAVLADIIFLNDVIEKNRKSGVNINHLKNIWDVLQVKTALLFNSQVTGIPLQFQQQQQKGSRGYFQRLKGKTGRFRGNLSGKRVEFTARSVISPDPLLAVDQVAVPLHIAKTLTFPQLVTRHNINKLRHFIENGPDIHPGANFHDNGRIKKYLRFADRLKVAKALRIGDIVERHLMDGDIVLFNRQPSLHRLSIQAFRAIVLSPDLERQKRPLKFTDVSERTHHRTLRFNECVCGPFNADFDGDEMNLHFPQTLEAQTEAQCIMGALENITTPKNGEPLTAAIQDFITASYLLTDKSRFFDLDEAQFLASTIMNSTLTPSDERIVRKSRVSLGMPAICWPIPLWTGKQIFSLILNPNQDLLCSSHNKLKTTAAAPGRKMKLSDDESKNNKKVEKEINCEWIFVNSTTKCKNFNCDFTDSDSLSSNDTCTIFFNGFLVCGRADKSVLGSGTKSNIFYKILKLYGKTEMSSALSRLTRLCATFLSNIGFSIGIGDVTPSMKLQQLKNDLLTSGYAKCDEAMRDFSQGRLRAAPGASAEETLESIMLRELSKIRESAGKACLQQLPKTNAALVMALCGSKGSFINISQMISCIGQQAIGGKRVSDGFDRRTLPHFEPDEKLPRAKGFVAASFFSGQTASEFFFHTMAGREGLVDTAVKTATTGYMQRRLSKCLEDVCVAYDGSVRDSATGEIVQFCYGEDGLDSCQMEGSDSTLLDFSEAYRHITNMISQNSNITDQSKLVESEEVLIRIVNSKFEKIQSRNKMEIKAKIDLINFLKTKFHENRSDLNTQICGEIEYSSNSSLGMTLRKLEAFLDFVLLKFLKSNVEPGTAVGAICSQAIGEPATQMTLKTFHFAGVASMNITQGVPRIQEIINAALKISTPIITVHLDNPRNEDAARHVKMLLESTTIGDIAEFMEQVFLPNECYLLLKISLTRINLLSLQNHVKIWSIAQCILGTTRLKILTSQITVLSEEMLLIRPSSSCRNFSSELNYLVQQIPNLVICGIPSIKKSVLTEDEENSSSNSRSETNNKDEDTRSFKLLLDGQGFYEVLRTPGVLARKSITNNILEAEKVLGIEATRSLIIQEMSFTMQSHGIQVDQRHLMLMADVMTNQGQVCGMTRHGLSRMKQSVFMLASFEKTCDHLFEAAYHGQRDRISGVSDSIIVGKQMKLGTGSFDLLYNTIGEEAARPQQSSSKLEKRSTLRELSQFGICDLAI